MRIVTTLSEARQCLDALPRPHGLVPTMGYLHEGHLSLIRRARDENAVAAATIFVNPTQFGPHEDLSTYPRDMPRDLALLEAEGVQVVFTPSVEEMYPPGGETIVSVGSRVGGSRERHVQGISMAWQRWSPSSFTSWRQIVPISVRRMRSRQLLSSAWAVTYGFRLRSLFARPFGRSDGLAISSRNAYLDTDERRAALVLSRALVGLNMLHAKGEHSAGAHSTGNALGSSRRAACRSGLCERGGSRFSG